ncbi:MAG: hypothetical protein KAS48_02260 [Gammaproteobacteria bacterium]|nr:hypothetical protein [Gammaproteobacteria bacterium]
MENRMGKRINENISVLFYSDGLPVCVGKTMNVAPSGVFVENGCHSENENQDVDMAFVILNNNETNFYRVNAHVVHRSQTGLGLMIDHFDEGPYTNKGVQG